MKDRCTYKFVPALIISTLGPSVGSHYPFFCICRSTASTGLFVGFYRLKMILSMIQEWCCFVPGWKINIYYFWFFTCKFTREILVTQINTMWMIGNRPSTIVLLGDGNALGRGKMNNRWFRWNFCWTFYYKRFTSSHFLWVVSVGAIF